MNLGQLVNIAAIAKARAEARNPGPTIEEGKRLGTVRVVAHLATYGPLPDADVDSPKAAPTPQGAYRRVERAQARAGKVVAVIQEAGKPLKRGEILTRTGMSSSNFDYTLGELMESGRVTRTGVRRHYLYGLPGMMPRASRIRLRPLSAETLAELLRSGDLVRTGEPDIYECAWSVAETQNAERS